MERQGIRRRAYFIVTCMALLIMGAGGIALVFGVGRRHAGKGYRDPEAPTPDQGVLVKVFAQSETRFFIKNQRYATMEELVKEGVLSPELLEGPVEGYRYRVQADRTGFVVTAEPEGPQPPPDPPVPGKPIPPFRLRRFYAIDQTHTLRVEETHPVTSTSPTLWSPRDSTSR